MRMHAEHDERDGGEDLDRPLREPRAEHRAHADRERVRGDHAGRRPEPGAERLLVVVASVIVASIVLSPSSARKNAVPIVEHRPAAGPLRTSLVALAELVAADRPRREHEERDAGDDR